jgi:protein subunit release factor B
VVIQNKTNSAVQLIHKPTGIVVKSQATRSRSQNQKIAREILAAKVEQLEKGEQSRTAIKQTLKSKRKASKAKKSRRKYRALEAERKGEEEGDVSVAAVEEEEEEKKKELEVEERRDDDEPNEQRT